VVLESVEDWLAGPTLVVLGLAGLQLVVLESVEHWLVELPLGMLVLDLLIPQWVKPLA
jgi:hypothetical protein